MFWAYILHSSTLDRYYVGHTRDLQKRLALHQEHTSRYTSRTDDWRFVFYQSFPSRAEAMALESRIKKGKSRKTIERCIQHYQNECSTSSDK